MLSFFPNSFKFFAVKKDYNDKIMLTIFNNVKDGKIILYYLR